MSNKIYILHHDDLDGITSGIIANEYFENAKLISCNYENKIDPLNFIDKNDFVIIVDYSFEPKIMQELYKRLNGNLIWIDHHISAINKSKQFGYDKIKGMRDINYCGAELTYLYYSKSKQIPLLLKEIGNFDMFRTFGKNEFEDTLSLFYGCMANQHILKDAFIDIIKNNGINEQKYFESFKKDGFAILRYKKVEYMEDGNKYSYVRNIWGKRVLCMNTPEGGLGLQLVKIFNPDEHDMILTYNYNGTHWCYGFYTDKLKHPEVNCAEIAETYGGGGHKSAAGAETDYIFEELLIQ